MRASSVERQAETTNSKRHTSIAIAAALIMVIAVSSCKNDDRRGEQQFETPATIALASYEDEDEGDEDIGSLTKDEALARYVMVQVGLAMNERCPRLELQSRDLVMDLAARIEQSLRSHAIDAAITSRVRGSAKLLAANLTCDDVTIAWIEGAMQTARETCAAMVAGGCPGVAQVEGRQ